MIHFIQTLISGLSLGSIYALIALGYTMVYGIAKMLNFAHGDIIMIGAYAGISADHDDVAMGKIEHLCDAVDHGIAQRDKRINAAQAQTADQRLDEMDHGKSSLHGTGPSGTPRVPESRALE